MIDTTRCTTVDAARMARLDPEGWHAAVCLDAEGEESLWLLAPLASDEFGCACPTCAPHEQLGTNPGIRPSAGGHRQQETY